MVNDFIVYDRRVEGNEICRCSHFKREHTFEGTKCIFCQCDVFDLSDMNGSTIGEIAEEWQNAWNEVNE